METLNSRLLGPIQQRRLLSTPPRFRSILWLTPLLFLPNSAARADDFWKHRPSSQWSREESLKLLRHSPWAKQEVVVFQRPENQPAFSIPTGKMHCDPDAIDANGNCLQKGRMDAPVDSSQQPDAAPQISPSASFLVRWESATPVAAAFARLKELGESVAGAFQSPPPRIPADRYVITVKLEQPGRAGFDPFLVTSTGKPALRASLKTSRGSVAPLEIEFTGAGAASAVHFFFPRIVDGSPLIGSGRDSVQFTLTGQGFAVRGKFNFESDYLQ